MSSAISFNGRNWRRRAPLYASSFVDVDGSNRLAFDSSHGRQRERERVLRSMAYTGQEDRGPFRVNASMCWRSGVTVRKLLAAFVCRGGNSGTVSHCRG